MWLADIMYYQELITEGSQEKKERNHRSPIVLRDGEWSYRKRHKRDNKNEAFSCRLLCRSSGDSLTQPAKCVTDGYWHGYVYMQYTYGDIKCVRTSPRFNPSPEQQLKLSPGISSSCLDIDTDTDIGKARPDSWSCGLLISARLISFSTYSSSPGNSQDLETDNQTIFGKGI
ncbi:unnamed protein product [Fusarium graminearum]|nr:unnamed protein product [Fusarium graminearum]CAF3637585.1 unnamed protein product [Fusarium graminearum]CAG1997930.1 unnamed protein product [Fusarium graminearum]